MKILLYMGCECLCIEHLYFCIASGKGINIINNMNNNYNYY